MYSPAGFERRLLATLQWSVATAVGFAAAKRVHHYHRGGAKENPGIRYEYRDFSNFLPVLKWGSLTFWGNFGSLGSKTCFCGSLRPVSWAIFLCFFRSRSKCSIPPPSITPPLWDNIPNLKKLSLRYLSNWRMGWMTQAFWNTLVEKVAPSAKS